MPATFTQIHPISLSGFQQSVTALSFDPVSDTLWAGSSGGLVSAHYGTSGAHGVQFPVGKRLAVRKIIAGDSNVRALNAGNVGSWAKGGMNKWHLTSASSLTTLCPTSNAGQVYAVATAKSDLMLIDEGSGEVVRSVQMPSMINHLAHTHSHLLSGSADGFIRAHDTRVMNGRTTEGYTRAHLSGIQGLQTTGNYAFTIGLGMRQGRPFPDPLVKVYDLRKMMKPLPPIPFASGPAFINVLPRRASSLIIASNQGLINIVSVANTTGSAEFCQVDTPSYLTSIAVSPTGAYIGAGDSEGLIHILTQADGETQPPFNGFDGRPIEWADTAEPLPDIEWTDTTPLNTIGLPYYETPLLSALPSSVTNPNHVYPPPVQIPTSVLTTMKYNENVAYATLPKELKGRRNLFVAGIRKHNGRFRSGKARSDQPEPDTPTFDYAGTGVPKAYRKVEIEYSKFGVEDFDFGFFNKTDFSGLETHILQSYTNAVVQVMNYLAPIRTLAKSHITTPCSREHCLLCELGFVVRMLEDARGTNCQSSNFCKTVGVLAQGANAIELVDYGRESGESNYAHTIQLFHRFLLDLLSSEGNYFPNNPILLRETQQTHDPLSPAAAPITQLLGIDAQNIITCSNCKATRSKENMTHLLDTTYPRRTNPSDPLPATDFASILRTSLLRQISHKATCQTCKRFANFTTKRSIPTADLPPLLAVNACVYNEETHRLWMDERRWTFLKSSIELQGQVEGVDDPEKAVYEVRSMVVQVVGKDSHSHLVAIVKVPEAESRDDLESPWFVFNDFMVTNITEAEALSFPDKWKVPAIIYLERKDVKSKLDFSALPNEIDYSILSRDTSISVNRDPNRIKHEVLSTEELPRPGTLVAIDAEFVSMQQEETEYRSDGSYKVIRPARLSLARVSVLRGDGIKQGVPFVDDHIHTSELIVDYLTEFSGIKIGDLDPLTSPHTLTPLKVVYKKLRMLVDRGCIFIGHGLSKDFRIINIFVPPEQVIDTVDLYFIGSRQRRLSLRFLSWFVLGEHIQTDNHDSIEDARSALNLYKAYHTYEEEGTFDQKLEELYKAGRQCNFRPPGLPVPQGTNKAIGNERNDSPTPYSRTTMQTSSSMSSAPYPTSHSNSPAPFAQSQSQSMPTASLYSSYNQGGWQG